MTIKKNLVLEALNDAGLEESALYEDYSGRGMYGDTCFGITGSAGDLALFSVALARLTDGEAQEWLGNLSSDNMGLSMIWYWRGVKLEQEVTA